MFILGQRSEDQLVGVQSGLVRCVRRALVHTVVDFSVHEGVRTQARQIKLFGSGASRTLDSYHLTGHAVDLVPYVDGSLLWQMPLCIQIAIAMREAAIYFKEPITWGAVWDRLLTELDPLNMEIEIALYAERYHAAHPARHPLVDGPHFQTKR